jgi:hypothetical protein
MQKLRYNPKSQELKETESVDYILSDIVEFARLFLNFEPFEYQKKFLRDNSKRISFRSGRQVGKSTLTAIKALYRAILKSDEQIIILSKSKRQSSLLFSKISEMVNTSNLIKQKVIRQTFTMLFFDNGSEIYSLPAGFTGDTIRGFSPTLIIIDEAAFVPDEVYIAIEPSLSATDGDLWLLSTPYGKRGRFYDTFLSKGFSNYHIFSYENPLIPKDFLESQLNSMTELDYKQEYEGEFVDEADVYFSKTLVMSGIDEIPELNKLTVGKIYYLSVDCARFGNDETVYMIGETEAGVNNSMRIVKIISTSKKPVTDIIGRVKELHSVFKFRAIFMDETGLGGGATDVLKASNLPLQDLNGDFAGITFTLKNKEEMYKNLKLLLEQSRIKYPDNDKLILQMSELQYEYSVSGGLKIHHPSSGNIHDDFPDALALVACGIRPAKPPLMFFSGGLK